MRGWLVFALLLAAGSSVRAIVSASVSAPGSVNVNQSYTVDSSGSDDQGYLTDMTVTQDGQYLDSVTAPGPDGSNFNLSLSDNVTAPGSAGTTTYVATVDTDTYTTSGSASVTIVQPNNPPTIEWTATPGTVYPGQNFNITAHGHDPDGNLTAVSIWVNGNPNAFAGGGNGTDETNVGNPVTAGASGTVYTFTAQAADSLGATSPTISYTVTVGTPAPTGSISGPGTANTGSPGSYTLGATTNTTSYTWAVTYNGGSLGTNFSANTNPLSWGYGSGTGTYQFYCILTGPGGTTNTNTITTTVSTNSAPVTTISSTAYAGILCGTPFTVTAITTDADGNLVNSGIDYLAPGSGTWVSGEWNAYAGTSSHTDTFAVPGSLTAGQPGLWQFRAAGTDSMGLTSSYPSISVQINLNSAPVTSITTNAPTGIPCNSPITITATSTDVDNNLVDQAIDYLAPGSGTWVSGWTSGAGWNGGPTGSHALIYTFPGSLTAGIPGIWQFRAAGGDSGGLVSNYPSLSVQVNARAPTGTQTITGGATLSAGVIGFYAGTATLTLTSDATELDPQPAGSDVNSWWWDQGNGSDWTHPAITWNFPANATGWSNYRANANTVASPTDSLTENWTSATPGTYRFLAGAWGYGNAALETQFTVYVATAPSATLTSSLGNTLYYGQSTTFTANYTVDAAHQDAMTDAAINVGPSGTIGGYSNSNATTWVANWLVNTAPGSNPQIYAYAQTRFNGGNWVVYNNPLLNLTIAKATPVGTLANQTHYGASYAVVAKTDLTAAFANPYTTSVTLPTGAITYSIVSATGPGASPTSGPVTDGTVLQPGTYQIQASYPGDANYNPAVLSQPATFTISATAPPPSVEITNSAGNTDVTLAFGQSVTLTTSATDAGANLSAIYGYLRGPQSSAYTSASPWAGWTTVFTQNTPAVTSYSYSYGFTPAAAGYYQYSGNAVNGLGWNGGEAISSTSYPWTTWNTWATQATNNNPTAGNITVNQATPVLPSGTFTDHGVTAITGTNLYTVTAGDLNAAFANPTNSSVARPTGTVTYAITAVNGPYASPTGAVAAGTTLREGSYTITATYPGDANYTAATATMKLTVGLDPNGPSATGNLTNGQAQTLGVNPYQTAGDGALQINLKVNTPQ